MIAIFYFSIYKQPSKGCSFWHLSRPANIKFGWALGSLDLSRQRVRTQPLSVPKTIFRVFRVCLPLCAWGAVRFHRVCPSQGAHTAAGFLFLRRKYFFLDDKPDSRWGASQPWPSSATRFNADPHYCSSPAGIWARLAANPCLYPCPCRLYHPSYSPTYAPWTTNWITYSSWYRPTVFLFLFMETWLKNNTLDSAIQLDRLPWG